MGDHGAAEREVEKAIITLKKGAQLLKYGRRGKPKLCLFRLSNDRSSLVWVSISGQRTLKLASVSRIVPGQRTTVFQRLYQPEKELLSFSLIYDEGNRSLDLVCKNKSEAEVWLTGLGALVSSGQHACSKFDGWTDGGSYGDENSDHTSSSLSGSSDRTSLDTGLPDCSSKLHSPKLRNLQNVYPSENEADLKKTNVTSMHVKGASSDVFRISVSTAPSTSSNGSGLDDSETLGDIYIWGEVICNNSAKPGADNYLSPSTTRTDVLLPKLLESNGVLDVQQVSCGVRHAALVTKQGEVFTWGEESGGRLGRGMGNDAIYPCLVDSLAVASVDVIACGEFHTCAVTRTGELYTWGDGTHNTGLLGHGTPVSHWIPRRVAGSLDCLHVTFVTCGTWHTALITTTGQLYTFGDGTFGVLGHGNRQTFAYPREVETLMGLKTLAVACGVWHTAAIVKLMVGQPRNSVPSGKLFTWGDGDKYRLGHGDNEARLKPTCISSLIDYNFHKLACGHSITVGLTTSGNVFTMGSTVYGQLGNPYSDGKSPCLVEDKLGETVTEVACGSYHVAVMTSRNEVYTWGKGANGRLGHGNIEDRKAPILVEALKDKIVKQIACGSNFTTAICHHKWVSGSEQAHCSTCRQAFGFTRKKHNCYNCGLVHCHSCSSRKAFRAALSPYPNKPCRVCDPCYAKLNRMLESADTNTKRTIVPHLSSENEDRFDMAGAKLSKNLPPSNFDLIKNLDIKAVKKGRKPDSLSSMRTSQAYALWQSKGFGFPTAADLHWVLSEPNNTSVPHSVTSSRAASPFLRKPSPLRSATPVPTMSGLSFSENVSDSLKKTNELLTQEVLELCAQVDNLKQRCEQQKLEVQKSVKEAQEAMKLAGEESAKSNVAKQVIKTLTAQLKEMVEKLPHGAHDSDGISSFCMLNGIATHVVDGSTVVQQLRNEINNSHPLTTAWCPLVNGIPNPTLVRRDSQTLQTDDNVQAQRVACSNGKNQLDMEYHKSNGAYVTTHFSKKNGTSVTSSKPAAHVDNRKPVDFQNTDASKTRNHSASGYKGEAERIEQYEPGVYITLVALCDGTTDLKRVRFSRRKFGEHHQAEIWWSENREKVYRKYNVRGSDRPSSAPTSHSTGRPEED